MEAVQIKIRPNISLIPLPLCTVRAYAEEYFKDETVEPFTTLLEMIKALDPDRQEG